MLPNNCEMLFDDQLVTQCQNLEIGSRSDENEATEQWEILESHARSDGDDEGDDSGDDIDFGFPQEILDNINFEKLTLLARGVRYGMLQDEAQPPIIGEARSGAYNVAIPLQFGDGVRWIAKIPLKALKGDWDDHDQRSLEAEAMTMCFIEGETQIPLPEVFDCSLTFHNDLGFPYILMSLIDGIPLYDVWYGEGEGKRTEDGEEVLSTRRRRALCGIAKAMKQLDCPGFLAAGSLLFDEESGKPSGVGPIRMDDFRISHPIGSGPHFVQRVVATNPKEWYSGLLEFPIPDSPFMNGVYNLLRLLISWIPEDNDLPPFVLAHPDLDLHNILVNEEGELQGIINWNGVGTVPFTAGNRSYPSWLVRDYDPVVYSDMKSQGRDIDSPDALRHWRTVYDDIMQDVREDESKWGSFLPPQTTRRTLITRSLVSATANPASRDEILFNLLTEIYRQVGTPEDLDVTLLPYQFAGDVFDHELLVHLKKGFKALLDQ